MATIKIQRTSEYNNRMRDYKIFVDGQQVGTISNGQTKEFTILAGRHRVAARIDWCSSPDVSITVQDNETKNLKVGGFKNGNLLMPLGLGIIVLHFILKSMMGFNYAIFLVVPIFLLLVYYLTIGRKKYLTLIETI
jgi:hypothetical protein